MSISILRVRGHLLVSVPATLTDAKVSDFQDDILKAIAAEKGESGGLLLDVGSMEIVDTFIARVIADTSKMAKLMGWRTVLCGMRPEIAGTLVQMGYLLGELQTAMDVDHGLDLLGFPR